MSLVLKKEKSALLIQQDRVVASLGASFHLPLSERTQDTLVASWLVKRGEAWLSLVPGPSRKNPRPQWGEAAGRGKAEGLLPSSRPRRRSSLCRDRVGTGWGPGGVAHVPVTEEPLLCVHTSHSTFHELKRGFCQNPQPELPKVLDDVMGPSPAAWPDFVQLIFPGHFRMVPLLPPLPRPNSSTPPSNKYVSLCTPDTHPLSVDHSGSLLPGSPTHILAPQSLLHAASKV